MRRQLDEAQRERDKHNTENLRLKEQLANVLAEPAPPTNLGEIRDRLVKDWKLAKRAESKERIKQAIDAFIKELTSP